jgi:hypothetical protein
MWVMTKSDWPVLINLNRAAQVGYQQVAKFDPKTRVVASTWEQEIVLAECADGNQARALVERIALALANAASFLDLRRGDLPQGAE